GIDLAGLLNGEVVDVRVAAERVDTVPDEIVLHPAPGVPLPAGARLQDSGDLLVLPGAEEGRALHRPELGANTHGGQVVGDGLGDGRVGPVAAVLACAEDVGIAGFGKEPLRL